MAFSEICRICLSVNVRMCVLKKTALQNFYKTLTNNFMDEDEEPIIVCFICHARLVRCRRLQLQAIESNAVLQLLLAGGSMSIPKPHEAKDEIQFAPISHIDIWPLEYDVENDCKEDDTFNPESVKVEEENVEYEDSKFEVNGDHETENADKQEDLPLIASALNSKNDDDDVELYITPTKIMKKNILEQKSVNTLTEKTSGVSTKDILESDGCSKNNSTKGILAKHISIYSHKMQRNSDTTAVQTLVEQTPVPQQTEIFYKEISSLQRRIKIHDGEKPFSCHICEFRCRTKSYLQKHMKVHTGEKSFSCNVCEYSCIRKSYLKSHMKIHSREKPFQCNICEFRCSTKSNLQKHMKIHTREKSSSCNICEFSCIRKIDLQAHMKKIHVGEKPLSCNICEFRCSTISYFQKHMKVHTGKKSFSCNICAYSCIGKSYLKTHMKIHTGEKPFSCNICEFRCIRRSDLQTHMKIHTGEKPLSCNICEYKCIRKTTLRTHIKFHTGEKPFSCNICEYRCITKNRLQIHMKIHMREKPFSCNICEYRCMTKIRLQRHMIIHTGAKPIS